MRGEDVGMTGTCKSALTPFTCHLCNYVRDVHGLKLKLKTTCCQPANAKLASFIFPSFIMARSVESWLQELLNAPWQFLYTLIQIILDKLLSPTPPPPGTNLGPKKIAVIGAGITGVSSASHCVGHGFDVTIFEAGSQDALGGIWVSIPQLQEALLTSCRPR